MQPIAKVICLLCNVAEYHTVHWEEEVDHKRLLATVDLQS